MKYVDCKINQLRKLVYNLYENHSMYYEKDKLEIYEIYDKIIKMNKKQLIEELNVKEEDYLDEKTYKIIESI